MNEVSYLAGAADHLFMTEWFSAACEGAERPDTIVEARRLLGLPPLA